MQPDAPPPDDSGLLGEPPPSLGTLPENAKEPEARVSVPLLSRIRTRLVRGDTLELRFHLAVKARIRLVARRRRAIVASTPRRVLRAGQQRLLLRLDPHSWPTKLQLQTHALAPLPTVPAGTVAAAGARRSARASSRCGASRRCPTSDCCLETRAPTRAPAWTPAVLELGAGRRRGGGHGSPWLVGRWGELAAPRFRGRAKTTAQTDDSVPAPNVTMIGSSPVEAPDETWGVGQGNGAGKFHSPLVRYTREDGWSLGPPLRERGRRTADGIQARGSRRRDASPLAGEIAPRGSGALIGEIPAASKEAPLRQVVLVRDPGGAFRETAALPRNRRSLAAVGRKPVRAPDRAPLLAALDEGAGHAGALVVPVREAGPETRVLHWDGEAWTREPIDVPVASSSDFRVLAIAASSPSNAWLLAQLSSSGVYPAGAVALFRRRAPSAAKPAAWVPVALTPGAGDEQAHPLSAAEQRVHGCAHGRAAGCAGPGPDRHRRRRVDRRRTLATRTPRRRCSSSPKGEAGGDVLASWCSIPASHRPAATPCTHELPDPLPTGARAASPGRTPRPPKGSANA